MCMSACCVCYVTVVMSAWCVLLHGVCCVQWQHNVAGLPVVDVVVDPHLTVHFRPHQRDGIVFLYQCVMAMKPYRGCGAILA